MMNFTFILYMIYGVSLWSFFFNFKTPYDSLNNHLLDVIIAKSQQIIGMQRWVPPSIDKSEE